MPVILFSLTCLAVSKWAFCFFVGPVPAKITVAGALQREKALTRESACGELAAAACPFPGEFSWW